MPNDRRVSSATRSNPISGWFWPVAGALCLLAAALLISFPASEVAKLRTGGIFQATDGLASLAGFTFLAAAIERIAQFTLAPWWGKVRTASVMTAVRASTLPDELLQGVPSRVGVAGAARLHASVDQASLRSTDTSSGALEAGEEAASVYVAVTKQRPTIMLPMAAGAAIICSYLHLFLLHSLAKAGLPRSTLAFVADGMLTGVAIAGGAQPFHDLVGNLTATSATKQKANLTS